MRRRFGPDLAKYLTKPVIPYVAESLDSHVGLLGMASVIFIGGGELAELPSMMDRLKRPPLADIPTFLHIDLVNGLSNDESGLRYVAGLDRIDGIITVRHHLAPVARKLGLMSVVRLFLQDGRAVERGLGVVEKSRPDAVELLPGVAYLEVADRFKGLNLPVIAGGLIRTHEIVDRIRAAGVRSVSTTNIKLWELNLAGGRVK
ncbi:MAG TPA: glycerol-3-phosphate responsive antiterminator [Tepidisphaeraceae bacterium]|jgi:glycerol uptake operon antiterminator|nr:glycerol-3-phosphate responsive antiterminator [Tepidisphaeraceae bacterium]